MKSFFAVLMIWMPEAEAEEAELACFLSLSVDLVDQTFLEASFLNTNLVQLHTQSSQ